MSDFILRNLRHALPAMLTIVLASVSPAQTTPKVIYGADDRIDWYQETHPERLALAHSTCALMRGGIVDNGNGTWTLNDTLVTIYLDPIGVVPLCDSEPFHDQPAPVFCSAFLVASDIVATAGHCLSSNVTYVKFVFNFYMIDANTPRLTVDDRDVYTVAEVLGKIVDNVSGEDWCLIRLDRPVTSPGAVPLPIRRSGEIGIGEPVGIIGHPVGWPSKIAWGETTVVTDFSRETQIICNVDAYGGNSGSALFNQTTGIVEGIMKGGDSDFVLNGECASSHIVPDDGGTGEGAVKTSLSGFQSLIPIASPAGPPLIDDSFGGDGDGIIESGESEFAIIFPVRNVGEETLTGLTATFSSDDLDVYPLDTDATYPAMDAGSTYDPEVPFTFDINTEHNFGTPINVTVSVTLPNDGGTRDYVYTLETQPQNGTGPGSKWVVR